jgi:hypothetical protein
MLIHPFSECGIYRAVYVVGDLGQNFVAGYQFDCHGLMRMRGISGLLTFLSPEYFILRAWPNHCVYFLSQNCELCRTRPMFLNHVRRASEHPIWMHMAASSRQFLCHLWPGVESHF